MRILVALLALFVTAAVADDARVEVSADTLRKLVQENIALRKEVNRLDADNEELEQKYRKQIGMVGACT